MRMSTRGRITIPKHLRDKYGFTPGTEVDITLKDGLIHITKKRPADEAPKTSGDEPSSKRARR